MPVRIEDAMPSIQAAFSAMMTGYFASSGRTFSAFAPRTTTTGHAADANAASTVRTTIGRPEIVSNCFASPIRDDAPAARITAPNLNRFELTTEFLLRRG